MWEDMDVDRRSMGTAGHAKATSPHFGPFGKVAFSLTTTPATSPSPCKPATPTAPDGTSGSGVANLYDEVDFSGGYSLYNGSFTVSGNGPHTVTFYSVDNVGNIEPVQDTTFRIGAAPSSTPQTTATLSGLPVRTERLVHRSRFRQPQQ